MGKAEPILASLACIERETLLKRKGGGVSATPSSAVGASPGFAPQGNESAARSTSAMRRGLPAQAASASTPCRFA